MLIILDLQAAGKSNNLNWSLTLKQLPPVLLAQ
jgi:hypothetical protein